MNNSNYYNILLKIADIIPNPCIITNVNPKSIDNNNKAIININNNTK